MHNKPTIVDFDHHSSELAVDPYPTYAQLRKCPVAWSERYGGFWVLSDYESVHAAAVDDETFSSTPTVAFPALPYGIRNVPIDTDNPDTENFRKILLSDFSPGAARKLEPQLRALADELIDGFIADGRCDLIGDYAMPLPARTILALIGFDPADWRWYVDRIHKVIHESHADEEGAMLAGLEMAARITEEMDRRRSERNQDGLIGKLLQAEMYGKPLQDEDILSYVLLLLFGGLDTTTGALGNAVATIDRNPELRNLLIERPEKLPQAVEELLRYEAPVHALGRRLTRDVEFGGCRMREGDRAVLIWASSNRDEKEFPDPDVIDVDRPGNRHHAFGVGIHRCLGSNHGRIMFRILLERLLARIPDFRIEGKPASYRTPDCSVVYAFHELPVTFTPGR